MSTASSSLSRDVLLLDMFGVIVTEGHLTTNILSKLFPGTELQIQRKAYFDYERNRIEAPEFWRTVGSTYSIRESEEMFFEKLRIDPDFYSLAEGVKPHMTRAVLSNMPKEWKERVLDLGIRSYLDEVFASGEENLVKPMQAFFELACRRLDVRPEQCLFVDDNISNLEAAGRLGMGTVWVDREQ